MLLTALTAAVAIVICPLSVSAQSDTATELIEKAASGDVAINSANFPDSVFRQYVLDNADTNDDNILSLSEINAVTSVNVSDSSIQSLKGIEYFTSLNHLNCRYNQLTSLDVSKNTALTSLYCDENQLSSLDVSKNTKLTQLNCCYNQLTSLDVSKNTSLRYLSFNNNHIAGIDLSKNYYIYSLGYGDNVTEVKANSNTISASILPGFDPSKASDWTGGTYNSANNTITFTSEIISYSYDINWSGGNAIFYLKLSKTAAASNPTNVKATGGANKVTLTWDAVKGAEKYAVSYRLNSSNKYTILTTSCTGTSYTASDLASGTTYYFLVQSYSNGAWSTFTTADLISVATTGTADPKPTNIKAVCSTNKINLTWNIEANATKYAVSIYSGGKYNILTTNCTNRSYTIRNLTPGTTYQLLVQAYVNGKWSTFTKADHVYATTAMVTKPENVSATGGANSATLTWSAVPDATKYAVSIYSGGKYNILTLDCTSTSYTATNLTAGITYQFLVQANIGGKWSTFTKADHVYAKIGGTSTKPANVKATGNAYSATLTWNAVPGAAKYAVSIYSGGKYNILTLDCTSTSYTATNLESGKTYQFLVQSYVGCNWSPFTAADNVSVTTVSTKPTGITARNYSSGNVNLYWNSVPGATKYAISTYSDGKYNILTTSCTSSYYTATGLTSGTTYQFLVQAYVGDKWSPFTTADHISVKVN